jgi:hypothetical protein
VEISLLTFRGKRNCEISMTFYWLVVLFYITLSHSVWLATVDWQIQLRFTNIILNFITLYLMFSGTFDIFAHFTNIIKCHLQLHDATLSILLTLGGGRGER